jgi:hypothetical protein
MKLQFSYEPNADTNYPCCAVTEYQGKCYHGLGKTWEEAEKHLTEKITAMITVNVPSPKMVEIPDEEMATEFFPFDAGNVNRASRDIEAGKL